MHTSSHGSLPVSAIGIMKIEILPAYHYAKGMDNISKLPESKSNAVRMMCA